MSRVGKKPILIPENVKVEIDGSSVLVKGPKGKLRTDLPEGIQAEISGGTLMIKRMENLYAPLQGLTRTLVSNSIVGITEGFKRELDIVGIGYRAEVKGSTLTCTLGFSHPIEFEIPEEISITVEKQTRVIVTGTEKQKVGQVAANIRRFRPPDPYKNKGIRYVGEKLRKKVGKTGVGATAQ